MQVTELILILERTQGGYRSEVMVQRVDTHAGDLREVSTQKRLRIFGPEPRSHSSGHAGPSTVFGSLGNYQELGTRSNQLWVSRN